MGERFSGGFFPRCSRRAARSALCAVAVLCAIVCFHGCRGGKDGDDDLTQNDNFPDVVPLEAADVSAIIVRAAEALDAPNLSVAVVDRVGNILGVWRRDLATSPDDLNKTVAVARAAAFLSSSQGPLSSRTLEFISTFHFPAQFGAVEDLPYANLVPQRRTVGVKNTSQGPLWQIFTSNRGALLGLEPVVDVGEELTLNETGVETFYNDDKYVPPARTIEGTSPSPGLGYLPGGIPLYKAGRVVGAVGCFGPDPNACEFAALEGAGEFAFPLGAIRPQGSIFLVGVLLPYVKQTRRPAGFGPGVFDPAGTLALMFPPDAVGLTSPFGRNADPFGYLIGPRVDPLGMLSQEEVETIINQGVITAENTRAAIRLPLGTTVKMFFTVCNRDGLILALFRMRDAPVFSLDVSVAKARTVVYYSRADLLDPFDAIPGVPLGTAITTRTLGFCSQPKFPPTIDGSEITGPLYDVALNNQAPSQFNRIGNAPFQDGLQNGLNFFPGSLPLYKAGVLVGGLAVSGDGVEQDDFVTVGAGRGFEAPRDIRADKFSFAGVQLPYVKFPQLPGRGRP